jgi:transposase
MQLKLPIFPHETKLFNASFGVFSQEGTVFYLHCGQPVGMHEVEDHNSFRHKIASFIEVGLCTQSEVVNTLHVSADSVRRSCQQYRQNGEAAFFAPDGRKGKSHKMLPQVLERVQKQLNEGKSVNSIAKKVGVREGTIRYCIQTGKLKKKIP